MEFLLLLLLVLAGVVAICLATTTTPGRLRGSRSAHARLLNRFDDPLLNGIDGSDVRGVWEETYRGRQFAVFTAERKLGGEGGLTMTVTVAAVRLPCAVPKLALARHTVAGKDVVELESLQFNDVFELTTDDDKFAYEVLHPGLMAFLLDDPRTERMTLTFSNADLHTMVAPGPADHTTTYAMLDLLCDVLDRVPSFVWQRRPGYDQG